MIESVLLFSSFLTSVLAAIWILVFASAPEGRISRKLLGFFLAVAVIREILTYVVISKTIKIVDAGFLIPIHLISLTVFYFYFCSLADSDFRLSKVSRWHALPVAVGLAWWFVWLVRGPIATDVMDEVYVFAWVVSSLSLIYIGLIQVQFKNLVHRVKLNHSSLSEARIAWVRFVLYLCYVSVGLGAFNLFSGLHLPFWFFRSIAFAIGLVGLTFFGLRFSKFIVEEEKPLTAKQPLAPGEGDLLANKLMKFLKTDEPYLKPQYRLSELAGSLGVKSYLISDVINRRLKTNFFDLINGLRIEKAKVMIADPAFAHMNLLGIATDSGFNSKSSFNECFTRFTGMTPSKYREQMSSLKPIKTSGLA